MDLSVYTRPQGKNRRVTSIKRVDVEQIPVVLNKPELLSVSSATECHVTPERIAEKLINYLHDAYDINENSTILEPQAGTGNIINALLHQDITIKQIQAIERHYDLVNFTQNRFTDLNINQDCFLEYSKATEARFNAIVCNPPFRAIKHHINAAIHLLTPNDSVLIALVPNTYTHDRMIELEPLGPDTFSTAKVHTKIILIEG